jgi:hypothetical protein
MTLTERTVRFMKQLDARDFYRLCAVVLGLITLVCAFFIYRYYAIAGDLQRKMQQLNKQRERTQNILVTYEKVRTQRDKVENLIERDGSFKIQPFFIQTVQGLGLGGNIKGDPIPTRHDLVEGWIEIRLGAALTGISMQQLVTLIQKLEGNERVYVRELHVNATPAHTLDILLHIATFEKIVLVS